MPRISKPAQANLPRLRRELRAYLNRQGLTPTAFSKERGVNQSTVQRFLGARTKTVTAKIKPLLEYAEIDFNLRIDEVAVSGFDNPRIREAINKVWDGRQNTAEILARLIESVGPVIVQSSQESTR